ncbi:MAG: hypothetical protein AAFO91_20130 [Bacteroidota bacterium]
MGPKTKQGTAPSGGSPVTGLLGPAIGLVDTLVGKIGQRASDARRRLPQWLSPADFQQKDNTITVLAIAGVVVLILTTVVLIKAAKK